MTQIDLGGTMCAVFQRTVAERADVVALRTKGGATSITWREYGARVRRYAAGLAGLGVRPGDTVAFLLTNRPEFNLLDTAAMHLGAVPFSIYTTSAPEQIQYLLADSGARVAITERALLDRLRQAAAGQSIVLVDGAADGTLTLADLEAAAPLAFDFEAAWRAVTPRSILTIIYTSGTTGPPKGVELTHANMIFELASFQEIRGVPPDSRIISYLPHAHIADRMGTYYLGMLVGSTLTTCPDPRLLFEHVPEVQPTEFTGVPRVWEKLKAGLEARFAAEPPERRAAIHGALEAGLAKVRAEQAGRPVPEALAAGVARAEEQLFAPLRRAVGLGATRSFFVGAAPTPRDVLEFFHAIGIPITEVWGMSELSCVATAMPPGRNKIGTVGKALPGVEIQLAEDGEVLVRGPLVMRGYRNLPERTAETIGPDGFLRTGDIGRIDDEGFLAIIDRKKELIITSGGKNISPANIEARIKTSSPLIGQAVVVGDARPYNVALLTLDPDGAAAFARARGLGPAPAALAAHEATRAEVARAIAVANGHLSRVEQIKRFELLPDEWLPGGDEITPTMKLKRKSILAKYAATVEALYAGSVGVVPDPT
jgi:long-subunit acyl-CoA synthetase (AMP-forming)